MSRIPGYWLLCFAQLGVTLSCSAASAGPQRNAPASSASTSDAGVPLHLWEAGPATTDAPRTQTRPFVPGR